MRRGNQSTIKRDRVSELFYSGMAFQYSMRRAAADQLRFLKTLSGLRRAAQKATKGRDSGQIEYEISTEYKGHLVDPPSHKITTSKGVLFPEH